MAGTSLKGIDFVMLGLTDNTGKLIADADKGLDKTGIALIDGDGDGATTANITALEEAGQQQYANNKVKRVNHGVPSPQVALTMLDMPYDIARKCVGYQEIGGGAVLGNNKPHVALMIASHDFDGNWFFDAFANGEMIIPTRNHGTSNKNETDSNVAFTYQSLAPIPNNVFVNNDGSQQSYKMYNSGDTGFKYEDMFKEVFGGYTGDNPMANYVAGTTAGSFMNGSGSGADVHA
ncbi:phage tail protein [Limosilactobacillus difficilis]|uniref:phage tail protein n=1 Tax=Limosilactobacillus difficilis TaxID=2991838 RepID=UPI0024B9B4AF|nr:phage tail protein [Limosilactobacillus difficilis]